jgi:hypothetical protein
MMDASASNMFTENVFRHGFNFILLRFAPALRWSERRQLQEIFTMEVHVSGKINETAAAFTNTPLLILPGEFMPSNLCLFLIIADKNNFCLLTVSGPTSDSYLPFSSYMLTTGNGSLQV